MRPLVRERLVGDHGRKDDVSPGEEVEWLKEEWEVITESGKTKKREGRGNTEILVNKISRI